MNQKTRVRGLHYDVIIRQHKRLQVSGTMLSDCHCTPQHKPKQWQQQGQRVNERNENFNRQYRITRNKSDNI